MVRRNNRVMCFRIGCVVYLIVCLVVLSGCVPGTARDAMPNPTLVASDTTPTRPADRNVVVLTAVAARPDGSPFVPTAIAAILGGAPCPPVGGTPTQRTATTGATPPATPPAGAPQTFPGPCVDRWYDQPLAFAPDGSALAIGGSVALALHNPVDGARRWAVALPARATALVFAPDGGTLTVGLTDGRVLLYRVADGALARTLDRPQKPGGFPDQDAVGPLAFSPDGLLLAAGYDGFAALWTLAATVPPALLHGSAGWVGSLAFAADGATLLILQAGQAHDLGLAPVYLYRWRVSERAASDSWPLPPLNASRLTGNGPTLAAASGTGVTLWTLALAPTVERTAPAPSEQRIAPAAGPYGNATAMLRLAFSSRGDVLVGATSASILLWDVGTATAAGTYPMPGSSYLNGVAIASGGTLVAAAFANGLVYLWRR